jgi:hypothetical protein
MEKVYKKVMMQFFGCRKPSRSPLRMVLCLKRMEDWDRVKSEKASSYMTKYYFLIYCIRGLFLIYDSAPNPFRISLYLKVVTNEKGEALGEVLTSIS